MSRSSHEYRRIHQRERLSLVADLLLDGALRVMESAKELQLAEKLKKERRLRVNPSNSKNPISNRANSVNPTVIGHDASTGE